MFFTWCHVDVVRRMPTWTLMRMPRSRASSQSCFATSKFELPGRAGRERERDQAVVGGEVGVADASDVLGMVQLAERPPLAAGRDAVGVDRADAGVLQTLDRRVGVIGRVVDVRPVEQRRDAAVERLERAGVVADVDVLGAVVAADAAEHDREVVVERAAREDAADRRLPRVPVRVDEPRHDDHPGRVDLLRVGDVEAAPDLDDLAVLDEDVAVRDLADVGVHRDDEAVADQQAAASSCPLLLGSADMDCAKARSAFAGSRPCLALPHVQRA